MKKITTLVIMILLTISVSAQTGWKTMEGDVLSTRINRTESRPDGKLFQLTYDYTQSPFTYQIRLLDSTGTVLLQNSFSVAGGNPSIRSFRIDTVQERLVIAEQSSDPVQFQMHLKVIDYNLFQTDSATFALLRSSVDSCELIGGGIDNTANKFLVYRYRDIVDQIWGRGVCRKNAAGTYKNNTVKVGQASNDGYYIHDYAIMPTGDIYIGGSRKESLYGNFFYLEKLNASMALVYEVKDQLIPNSTDTNRVTSLHVYTNNTNSQVVVGGTIYGLAPGDTITRCHGILRCYTFSGVLKWSFQNYEVRDYRMVVSRNSYVHAVGSSNNNPGGFDTKISRLFLKDGVVDWHRYYGNKSKPVALEVEKDGSLLICGDKQFLYPLTGGGTLKTRSYMMLRYSKRGKKLYDYNHVWNLPFNPASLNAGFTDLSKGRSTFYYAAGYERISYENGSGIQFADSILLQQFSNGSLRIGPENKTSEELSVHPNPAGEEITFRSTYQLTDMRIVSISGSLTDIEDVQQEGNSYRCDISRLAPGMYVLKVLTDKGWRSAKFIKE
ncbi:MAG: T9SS type A sorting domain-containing protein [Bacteroidetes bacterium]|nr:T9SS type A sorting domain-containing protein [Bacteroidota bacterium]